MACVGFGDDLFGENGASKPRNFVSVDGGESFSIGVTQEGDVVGWGSAFYGELGDHNGKYPAQRVRSLPVAIHMTVKCLSVACGLHHVLVLSIDGDVYAWGRNAHGETAQSPSTSALCSRPIKVIFSTTETIRFVALAAGGNHSLALDSTGIVWSWGDNTYGQLGLGTTNDYKSTPQCVTFPHDVAVESIAAGHAHSAAVARDRSVFTFGWGLYHQLGHGTTDDCHSPMRVDALDGIDGGMCAVACGTWHTAAISAQSDVYTWGWGPDGQLGPSQGTSAVVPSVVDTLDEYFAQEDNGHHADHVACGARSTVVMSRAGDLFCWGRNGQAITRSVATHTTSTRIKSIAVGHSHLLVLVDSTTT